MMVALIFPGTWTCNLIDNSIWYFVRGGRGENLEPYSHNNNDSFFKWIDNQFAAKTTARRSLIVYPEGHRNTTDNALDLKVGFIRV
jgi:hypothetical protein